MTVKFKVPQEQSPKQSRRQEELGNTRPFVVRVVKRKGDGIPQVRGLARLRVHDVEMGQLLRS